MRRTALARSSPMRIVAAGGPRGASVATIAPSTNGAAAKRGTRATAAATVIGTSDTAPATAPSHGALAPLPTR
jgi:hypothetical protein